MTHPLSAIGKREFIALVALLMSVNAMAIDIVIPALLLIGDLYGVAQENDRQWLITAYLFPFGVGQLLFGTLSDVFGRKRVILGGLALYASASFLTPLAPNFAALLILRALCGLGAASVRVAIVAVVRDCFSGREMAAVMSVVMLVFMSVPIFAPLIGQIILLVASWSWIFIFMGLFAAFLIVWMNARLPETLASTDRKQLNLHDTISSFRLVLSTRRSIGYSIAQALFFGCLFGFVNAAPQIYLQMYELGGWFPLAFAICGCAIACSNLANARIVRRFGMRRISHTALTFFLVISATFAVVSWWSQGPVPLWAFIVATSVAFTALGFVGTNFNAIALEPLGEVAGTASAIFGFIQTAGAASIGAIIGQTYNGSITPILAGFVVCSVIALGFVFWAERYKMFVERDQR